jgi:hypothetical protein
MFMQANVYSWSEAHYLLGIDQFNASIIPAGVLATVRNGLLGSFAGVTGVRLSQVPANRLTFDLPPSNWPATPPTGPIPDNQFDAPFTSLMLKMQGAGATKNLYLAGIPDDIVQYLPGTHGGYNPTGAFTSAINSYLSVLTASVGAATWGFRSRLPQPFTNVLGVQSQAGYNNNAGVVTATNPGVLVGQEAYLKGFRVINPRVPNLAGAYQVIAVIPPGSGNPNWITVLGETGNVEGTNFEVYGYIQLLAFTYIQYVNGVVKRATHRKRGGSYGRPRGRSRVRR